MAQRRRLGLLVATLIAFVLAAAAGGAALFVLAWRTGYGDQAVDTLSSAHREILEALEEGTFRYFIADGVLGWSLQPNGSRDSYAANSDGIRASKEYAHLPPEGVFRIASFGDSFTHGDGGRQLGDLAAVP